MRNKFLIIAIVLTTMFVVSSKSSIAQYSTQGLDFWFSFMPNIGAATAMVSITCDVNTSGVISMPGQGWTQNFTVTQNSTTQITVPNMYNPVITTNQVIQPQAIHIVTNDPVSVYAFNDVPYTTDATIILPTPVLGNEYYVTTYEPLNSVRSGLLIVGAENNSIISITPSQTTQGGNPPGVPFNITLNQGETYLVQGNSCQNLTCDMSGTLVSSLNNGGNGKNFAVFGGSQCVNIPMGCTACDHIVDQMLPICTWGTEYILPRLATKSFDVFRFIASQNNTSVVVNGGAPFNLNAGQFIDQQINAGSHVVASKPISVTQYCTGSTCDGVNSDPFEMVLSPTLQVIDDIVFDAFTTPTITSTYVNIVTETSNINNVLLDGNPVPGGNFTPVPGSTFSYAQVNIVTGSHTLQSAAGFLAYVYGFGPYNSYGYTGGVNVKKASATFNINLEDSTFAYFNFNDTLKCGKTTITVISDTSGAIDSTWWNFGDSPTIYKGDTITHSYGQSGSFTITYYYAYTGSNICGMIGSGTDSIQKVIHIKQYIPFTVGSLNDTVICPNTAFTQIASVSNGEPPFSYQWSMGGNVFSTSQTGSTIPANAGQVKLVVADGCGFKDSVTFMVSFYTPVQINMPMSQYRICEGNPITINTVTASGGKPNYQFDWYHGGVPVGSGNPITYVPSAPGTGMVIVTDDCGSKDTAYYTVSFYGPMSVSDVPDVEICRGKELSLEVTASGSTGSYSYSWELNNNQVGTGNPYMFKPSESGLYKVVVSDECSTKTAEFNIKVLECEITIPNIITPNGDGNNDVFVIKNIEYYDNTLMIFNRWGKKVLEASNYANDWDAKGLSDGTYFYTLKLDDGSEHTGHITVLR